MKGLCMEYSAVPLLIKAITTISFTDKALL